MPIPAIIGAGVAAAKYAPAAVKGVKSVVGAIGGLFGKKKNTPAALPPELQAQINAVVAAKTSPNGLPEITGAIAGGELDNVTITAKKNPLSSLPPWAIPVGAGVVGLVVLKSLLSK